MIEIHDSFDAIDIYREDWNKLAEARGNALLTFDWFRCCSLTLHKKDKLFLVCITKSGRLVAVAPLIRSNDKEQRHLLQIPGSRRLYEPTGLLYEDNDTLIQLFNALEKLATPVLINRSYQEAEIGKYFPRLSTRGIFYTMQASASQYLQLTGNIDEFEASLSSRRRSDLRRAENKALQIGQIGYSIHHANKDNVDEMLAQAFAIENSSWKGQSGSSIDQNNDLKDFFQCLFRQYAANGNALIGFLTIDGKAIACNLALQQFNRIWILKIGYDEKYSACSPGILLTHGMIRYACSHNISGFEFLGCREQWIELWRPQARDYYSYLYYPLSYMGMKGLIFDGKNMITRRIKHMLRASQ